MIGMLAAIPKTPLYARLEREGRLDLADEANVWHQRHPLALTRNDRARVTSSDAGCFTTPKPISERLEDLYLNGNLELGQGLSNVLAAASVGVAWAQRRSNLATAIYLYHRLMANVPETADLAPRISPPLLAYGSLAARSEPGGPVLRDQVRDALSPAHDGPQMAEQHGLVNTF